MKSPDWDTRQMVRRKKYVGFNRKKGKRQ